MSDYGCGAIAKFNSGPDERINTSGFS